MDWMTQYCKEVYSSQIDSQIQCNPNQNPNHFEIDKLILEFSWKCTVSGVAKMLFQKNKEGALTPPDTKMYKATVIKILKDGNGSNRPIKENSKTLPYIKSHW